MSCTKADISCTAPAAVIGRRFSRIESNVLRAPRSDFRCGVFCVVAEVTYICVLSAQFGAYFRMCQQV